MELQCAIRSPAEHGSRCRLCGQQGDGTALCPGLSAESTRSGLSNDVWPQPEQPGTQRCHAAANGIAYPYPGFQGTVASALRPYPQVQGNQTVSVYGAPVGFSTYHSLQVTVIVSSRRASRFTANYTWSKNMTNMQSSLEGDNAGRPLDFYNLSLEKSISADDQPHLVKVFFSWDTPIGRGRAIGASMPAWLNAVVGNWQVSGILNYFSGTPLSITTSTSPFASAWNGTANRANILSSDVKAPDRTGEFQPGKHGRSHKHLYQQGGVRGSGSADARQRCALPDPASRVRNS